MVAIGKRVFDYCGKDKFIKIMEEQMG